MTTEGIDTTLKYIRHSRLTSYIVASSKTWHFDGFKDFIKQRPENWSYVENTAELLQAARDLLPRYIFFLHWNWLVPSELHQKFECVCFHMTDLPYGRGGSPLQNLIMRGNVQTMVTALRMVREMDAGPIYCKRPLPLEGRAEDIYLRAGKICWEMTKWIVESEPQPQEQVGEVTVFKRRSPDESEIPMSLRLEGLYDFIRMLDAPTYPNAFIKYGNLVLQFSDAILSNGHVEAKVVFRLSVSSEKEAENA